MNKTGEKTTGYKRLDELAAADLAILVHELDGAEWDELVQLKKKYREEKDRNEMSEDEKKRFLSLTNRLAMSQMDTKWTEVTGKFEEMEQVKRAVAHIENKVDKATEEMYELFDKISLAMQKTDKPEPTSSKETKLTDHGKFKSELMNGSQRNTSAVETHGSGDTGHLIPWPVEVLERLEQEEGTKINWQTSEPRDSYSLVKREMHEDVTGKTGRNRMRERAARIAAFAEGHKLTAPVIMAILRQTLGTELRDYFDVLCNHGLAEKDIWYSMQQHGEQQFTSTDAIKAILELIQTPNSVKLAEVNLRLPPLVKLKFSHLTDSEEDRARLVEHSCDELYAFLVANVTSTLVMPLIEQAYRDIKELITDHQNEGQPMKHAYITFYNNLMKLPTLKTMEFRNRTHGKATSGMEKDPQDHQFKEGEIHGKVTPPGAPWSSNKLPGGYKPPFPQGKGQGYTPQWQTPSFPSNYASAMAQAPTHTPTTPQRWVGPPQGQGQGGGSGQGFLRPPAANPGNGNMGQDYRPPVGGNPGSGPRMTLDPRNFPTDLTNRCWKCYELDDHMSKNCTMYPGEFPSSPLDPNNRCQICSGFHRSHCVMPAIWAEQNRGSN
jgi:hypothetical protein